MKKHVIVTEIKLGTMPNCCGACPWQRYEHHGTEDHAVGYWCAYTNEDLIDVYPQVIRSDTCIDNAREVVEEDTLQFGEHYEYGPRTPDRNGEEILVLKKVV
jgi:hypothetical protein